MLRSVGCALPFPPESAALYRADNASARLAVTPSVLDLGNVAIGLTVQRVLTARNTGEAALDGAAEVTIPSGAPPGFALVSGSPFAVAGGASAPLVVGFTASGFGAFEGVATVMSNGGWATVALTATVGVALSGRVLDALGEGVAATRIELHGAVSAVAMTDAAGSYVFYVQPDTGSYTVVPADPRLVLAPASRAVVVASTNLLGLDFTVASVSSPVLLASVLPSSRSVQVGAKATAFATILNTGPVAASGCGLGLQTALAAQFSYRATDAVTHAFSHPPNVPVAIPAGGAQTYVLSVTPTAALAPTDVELVFGCANTPPAPTVVALNTLLLSASVTPVPDIVALAATLAGDGIVTVPGPPGIGVFAVATVNVGVAATITVSADTGGASLPLGLTVCRTNPATGACLAPPAALVTFTIDAGATPTVGVFAAGVGAIPFDPAGHRVFVRFRDGGGVTRGATSVAVRTP